MSTTEEEIINRLDILITLLIPPYSEDKYKLGADVLRYCDAYHSADDIAKKLKKTKNAVEVALTKLRDKGHVQSVQKGSKTFYVRLI